MGKERFGDIWKQKDTSDQRQERQQMPVLDLSDLEGILKKIQSTLMSVPSIHTTDFAHSDYIKKFFRLTRNLPRIVSEIGKIKPNIRQKSKELEDYQGFRGLGYEPLIRDFTPFISLDSIIGITTEQPAHFLNSLSGTVDYLTNPAMSLSIPHDFSVFYGKIKDRPTPVGSKDGPFTTEEVLKIIGLETPLEHFDKYVIERIYYPLISQYISHAENGLKNTMFLSDLGQDILEQAYILYGDVKSYFTELSHTQGEIDCWEIKEDNPILTAFAIDVFKSVPYIKKDKKTKKRDIPIYEREHVLRRLAQLTEPKYFSLVADFDKVIKLTNKNYVETKRLAEQVGPNLKSIVLEATKIQGKDVPGFLTEEEYPFDLVAELNKIDFKHIREDNDRRKKLSKKQRKMVDEKNKIIDYVIKSLSGMAQEKSYSKRLDMASVFFDEISIRNDKLETLSKGTAVASRGSDNINDHYRIEGNVFAGAGIRKDTGIEKKYKEEIVESGLSSLVHVLEKREKNDVIASLWNAYFPKKFNMKPLIMVGAKGTGKTSVLKVLASRTNSMYVDFKDVSVWKFPSITTSILGQILDITESSLNMKNKPSYLLIDNFLQTNPQEEQFWTEQASQMGETFSTMDIKEQKLAAALFPFMSQLSKQPMLRVVMATDNPEYLFREIPANDIMSEPGSINKLDVIASRLSIANSTDKKKPALQYLEFEGEFAQGTSYALSNYFDIVGVRPLTKTEAGELLRKKIEEKLPVAKDINWSTLFGNDNLSGNYVDTITESLFQVMLTDLNKNHVKLAANLSEYYQVNGDTPETWTYIRSKLRPFYRFDSDGIKGAIKAANEIEGQNINGPMKFTQDLAKTYNLRCTGLIEEGRTIKNGR